MRFGVFIGRFQPFHHGHLHVIESAFAHCEQLVLVIGSAFRARTVKNPFSYAERKQLIRQNLIAYDAVQGTDFAGHIHFIASEDVFYDEQSWCGAIRRQVDAIAQQHPITLFGHDKDDSTYYLSRFSPWNYMAVDNFQQVNATPIREQYLLDQSHSQQFLSKTTTDFLENFAQSPAYQRLQNETAFLLDYKRQWLQSPYPPIFVTVDSLVTCQQHILFVQRKFCPGQGLWALPGGFIAANESLEASTLRELREETAIDLSDESLRQAIKQHKVFDYPERSQIGRVITHVTWFDVPSKRLPEVVAGDDAANAIWIPFNQLTDYKDQLHDDHYQIICHLEMIH